MRFVVHTESILFLGGALFLCPAMVWAMDGGESPSGDVVWTSSQAPSAGPVDGAGRTTPAPDTSPSQEAMPASPYGPPTSQPVSAIEPYTAPPPTNSQPPTTLFDPSRDYAITGMGGFAVTYTRMAGANAAMMCGEGAVILDHTITFGGGGCGLISQIDGSRYGDPPHDPNDRLVFGYGGAIVRYHLFARKTANLAVGGLVGAGGVSIERWNARAQDWEPDHLGKRTEAVFVIEPQVGGYLNMTRWLRLGLAAGYRLVAGADMKGLSSSDLNGPTASMHVQAGWF